VSPPANLFALRPRRQARFNLGADGLVTVLVPKFTNRLAVRWLVPLLARPDVTVRLDAQGSFVWDRCDGATTVLEIADGLHAESGGDLADIRNRVAGFVQQLARNQLVTLEPSGEHA
jgi:hypothetical protein